jgi:hypothetical protein
LDFLTSVPKDNREVWDSQYSDSLSDNAIIINQASRLYVSADQFALKPNSTFTISAYSTLTSLGSATTDANGEIAGTFTVPTSVEPGYHTLHVRGEAITGEKIDIQKIIYVAASDADFDGDGITNINEPCVVGDASGQDIDKDGVDDACDALISEPPAVIVTPPPADPEPTPPTNTPQPTEPSPVPDPVDPQKNIPPETPVQPPVNDPTPPIVVTDPIVDPVPPVIIEYPPVLPPVIESEKVLPEPESNPQWLIDLTTQKQAELNARLAASAAQTLQNLPAAAAIITNTATRSSSSTDTPSTVVAGVSTSAAKVDIAKPIVATTYARQTPELAVLLVAIGLLSFGTLLVLWKLNRQV